MSQKDFVCFLDERGQEQKRCDRSYLSPVENWGTPNRSNGRPITESLLVKWYDCLDYWWKRNHHEPPPVSLLDVLGLLWGVESQARRGRSLGKELVVIRFFGDSGSHSETKEGVTHAAAYFGLNFDPANDFACEGNPATFVANCEEVMALADEEGCHMVLVELPPDSAYLPECSAALMKLARRGQDGLLSGVGYVTVVMGLSPLHRGLVGTMDSRDAISEQLSQLVTEVGREHVAKTRGSVRVLTLTGGAACMAYHRNDALVPGLKAVFGPDAVATECVHPSEGVLLRQLIERYAPEPSSRELLIVVPLYFGGTRLVSELVPALNERFVVVSTDLCQDFIRRMAVHPQRWVATVATDLWQVGWCATAYAERLSIAEFGHVEPPSRVPLTLPAVTVQSGGLHDQLSIDRLRPLMFVPALRKWASDLSEHPWLLRLVDDVFPVRTAKERLGRSFGKDARWNEKDRIERSQGGPKGRSRKENESS